MTPRTTLGAIAAELAGDRVTRRSAMLARVLAGRPRRAVTIEALASAPEWLRLDTAARRQLGQRAALAAIAPAIAHSVDGSWLGGLARVAGDAAIDWAAKSGGSDQIMPAFSGDQLDAVGAGLIRAATPAAFRGFVDDADCAIDPAQAVALVERAART